MTTAFIIRVKGQTAGLAVVTDRGFCFAASDRRFRRLDGRHFKKVRQIQTAIEDVSRNGHHSAKPGMRPH